jgi:hypothetical protein
MHSPAHNTPPAHMTHDLPECIVVHMTDTPTQLAPACDALCDEDRGYQRHRWYDQEPCGRSKRAHAAHNRQRRRELAPPEPRKLADHGTRSRYERERKAFKAGTGPKPCDVCTLANTARTNALRAAKAAG